MDIKLTKEISNARVISGFPGFGLVATIATEFLTEHLDTEVIGRYWFEDQSPNIAIHGGKVINPITIYYNEEYNMVIIHAISGTQNLEWKAAEFVHEVCEKVNASEVISLEGVASNVPEKEEQEEEKEPTAYYHTTGGENIQVLEDNNISNLTEGMILGVTAALMLKSDKPMTNLFVETHSQLPDSKAAAKLIEVLDNYIPMNVDYHPLQEAAQKFQGKLQDMMQKSQQAQDVRSKKDLNYLG